jgi:hypothetical protein
MSVDDSAASSDTSGVPTELGRGGLAGVGGGGGDGGGGGGSGSGDWLRPSSSSLLSCSPAVQSSCHGDYCDGSLPFYFAECLPASLPHLLLCANASKSVLNSESVRLLSDADGAQEGGRRCSEWMRLLRYFQMTCPAGLAGLVAPHDGRQERKPLIKAEVAAHHIPLEIIHADRKRRRNDDNKRMIVHACRSPAPLTSEQGAIVKQCLNVQAVGRVAEEGLQVWAEYSGKMNADVKFTLTSPAGSVVSVERFNDDTGFRKGVTPDAMGIHLIPNLEIVQMVHTLQGQQVCGTWEVALSRSVSLPVLIACSFSFGSCSSAFSPHHNHTFSSSSRSSLTLDFCHHSDASPCHFRAGLVPLR